MANLKKVDVKSNIRVSNDLKKIANELSEDDIQDLNTEHRKLNMVSNALLKIAIENIGNFAKAGELSEAGSFKMLDSSIKLKKDVLEYYKLNMTKEDIQNIGVNVMVNDVDVVDEINDGLESLIKTISK